jgi:Omp85 superfamily domain
VSTVQLLIHPRSFALPSAAALLALMLAAAAPAALAQDASQPPADAPSQAQPSGLLSRSKFVARLINFADSELDEGSSRDGFYPEVGNMITGSGWISAGPGYRRRFWHERALVDGSAALSWRTYKMAQARVELPHLANNHLALGSQVRWQDLTQVNYFGVGPDSLESERSQYRLKNTDVIGYAVVQLARHVAVRGTFGRSSRPTLSSATGSFKRGFPDARQVFSEEPGVAEQTSFLHGDVSMTVDTRDYPGHPTSGGLYRGAAATYSDRDLHQFSFQRYEAEGLQMIPMAGDRWTFALHAWLVASDASSSNNVPFYMLPSLGGHSTLRGYYDYRFHDRNLLVANVESRWALFSDIDAVVFFDAGNVAPRVGDLNLNKTSYGAGVRVHSQRSTMARLDVGHSHEGWRLFFRLTDPLELKRLARRTAVIPFVP